MNRAFELRLERTIATELRHAFEAFSQPSHVSRWFTTRHEAELRPGGGYRNADGDHGTYLRIEPPNLISFTWENDAHCPGTVVTASFRESKDGEVLVSLVHSRLATSNDVEEMRRGWSWALASFQSYVESGRPIPHEEWLQAKS